jgi:hypothetical protein
VVEDFPGVFHLKIYALLQFFGYFSKLIETKIFIIVFKEHENRLRNPMNIGSPQWYYLEEILERKIILARLKICSFTNLLRLSLREKDYRSYYTAETRDGVAQIYERDIALFKYKL